MKKIILLIIIMFLILGGRQTTIERSGSIYGSVLLLNQNTHGGVIITATGQGSTSQALTDDTGFYTLSGLAAGVYQVSAQKDGWFIKAGDTSPKTIVITDGQSILNVDFILDSNSTPPALP